MTKTSALVLAAFAVAFATPALAHCGGSHGKAYRTATVKKTPVVAKAAQPNEEPASGPAAETTAPAELNSGTSNG
jgi:hypothetical protein